MSYPMNEFETDLEKPYKYSEEWIAAATGAVSPDLDETGDGTTGVKERGGDFATQSAGKPTPPMQA